MAITHRVTATGSQAFGTSVTSAALTGVQAGDLLTFTLRERDGSGHPVSISDSVNGSWAAGGGGNYPDHFAVMRQSLVANIRIYYYRNSAAGSPTVTVTYGGNTVMEIIAQAWAGADTAAPLDVTSAAHGTGTSHAHGSITTTTAGLVLAALGCGGGDPVFTPESGFTDTGTYFGRNYTQYRIYTGTTTVNVTPTSDFSADSDRVVAAFKEATGGGGGSSILRQMMEHHR